MIKEGDIVLFKFPQTDLEEGKLRPALVLRDTCQENCVCCINLVLNICFIS